MENRLNKRYGLITAVCMVVGIVVGSGVFFKAEKILTCTGGRMSIGIIAWIAGGLIMVACAYTFGMMASRYEKCNGIVDYAEQALGEKYGYVVGWFMAVIYYPTLTSVLSWVTARYFCVLMGWDITGPQCMLLSGFLLISVFVVNVVSPVLSGRIQVATTVIKFVPLVLMAAAGTVTGLRSGMTAENFGYVAEDACSVPRALFTSICATSFAYEGWIIATSINSEIKDSKKNLPRALFWGTLIIVAIYIVYYIGLAGAVDSETMMSGGEEGAKIAFQTVFTKAAGTGVFVLIVVSCYGVLNGLMMGNVRGLYSLAVRGQGYNAGAMAQVDSSTNMPMAAGSVSLLIAAAWLLYFYGADLAEHPWFGPFSFDTSELPIVTIYALYIPIFISFMKREKDLGTFRRFVMPSAAVCGSLFMMLAAVYSHREEVIYYLIVFAALLAAGLFRMNGPRSGRNGAGMVRRP